MILMRLDIDTAKEVLDNLVNCYCYKHGEKIINFIRVIDKQIDDLQIYKPQPQSKSGEHGGGDYTDHNF